LQYKFAAEATIHENSRGTGYIFSRSGRAISLFSQFFGGNSKKKVF